MSDSEERLEEIVEKEKEQVLQRLEDIRKVAKAKSEAYLDVYQCLVVGNCASGEEGSDLKTDDPFLKEALEFLEGHGRVEITRVYDEEVCANIVEGERE